ncbi:sugar-binding transcriptional regulator [Peribacillus sp. SCS-26]|uniref:sugar-binding transcriptional regulator n=1 Tax=Paraperibacillus marinus TaxID=3115295 RepID=UPI003906107A
MKGSAFEENLLIKAAWYYYKNNLTQNEIADILELSRNKVVRLLEKARSDGIVQFNIKGSGMNCLSTECDFIKFFGLSNAYIIPTVNKDLPGSLAQAASQFLENRLEDGDMLGIGWGEAVSKTLQSMNNHIADKVSIVTLTGGVNHYFQNQHEMNPGLSKFGGRIHMVPAPFLASSQEMADSLLSEPSVGSILQLAGMCTHTLVGIGGLSADATIVKEQKMTVSDMAYIKSQKGAGDILGQFFDRDGHILHLPHHKQLIGISLEKLKKADNVIGVAGGRNKTDAIYGALKGGYINTLITDEQTALTLMEKEAKE